jgi:nicotinamidase-related amidase
VPKHKVENMMLNSDKSVLAIIDVQGRLADAVQQTQELFDNINRLAGSAQAMNIPMIVTEQLPEKLGATRPEICEHLAGTTAIAKSAFSCCGEPEFMTALKATGKTQVILCGMETHICVLGTAIELIDQGYEVFLVADAASSRTLENKNLALARIRQHGAQIIATEMALFEWMRDAKHPAFREVRKFLA